MIMNKNYVIFLSPGTFCSETTKKSISSWNEEKAAKMAKGIVERYGATPYGFYFITEIDNKEVKKSNTYFLGGVIKTLRLIQEENNPKDEILISNMKCNGWGAVIINTNSYKITLPFEKGDVLLDY